MVGIWIDISFIKTSESLSQFVARTGLAYKSILSPFIDSKRGIGIDILPIASK